MKIQNIKICRMPVKQCLEERIETSDAYIIKEGSFQISNLSLRNEEKGEEQIKPNQAK